MPKFIRDNTEQILAEWEAFAGSLPVTLSAILTSSSFLLETAELDDPQLTLVKGIVSSEKSSICGTS